ncbi:MAG: LuxR C-terminal-related transcriptional regulator [Gaiellaceae bacterium]
MVSDRYPLWLEGLRQFLARLGLRVIGSSTDLEEAPLLVESLQPDLLVVGLESPDEALRGLACVERARQARPELRVVVLSPGNDHRVVAAAFAAGAVVYCTKSVGPSDLAAAIRQAFEHSVYVAAPHTDALSEGGIAALAPTLTRREIEILRLAAEGRSNSQLAQTLWVTEQTVKFHLSNVYKKLNVSNRTEASRWAQLHGLLPPRETTISEVA